MNARRTRTTAVAGALLVASACLTVNIYFPAAEVRDAAEQIVEETWGDGALADEPMPEPTSSVGTWALGAMAALVSPSPAYAADADLDLTNAAIRALRESIKKRALTLKPHLTSERVGLVWDGTLAVRNTDGLGLREQAELRRLVEAENRDRASLYREIALANDLGEENIDSIRRIFADEWLEKADRGWWVRDKNGEWSRH